MRNVDPDVDKQTTIPLLRKGALTGATESLTIAQYEVMQKHIFKQPTDSGYRLCTKLKNASAISWLCGERRPE